MKRLCSASVALVLGCRMSPVQPAAPAPDPVTRRVLMHSSEGRPVEVAGYPGSSTKVALVLAGVHGSERSAIELCAVVEEAAEAREGG